MCPSVTNYSYDRRSGRTCYYSRTLTTTRSAPRSVSYVCPSVSRYTYKYRSGTTCHYSKTLNTTRLAPRSTTYTCPSVTGYTLLRRSDTTCHYSKTLNTTRHVTTSTQYTCPTAPTGYSYDHITGTTCHYNRPSTTTLPATVKTTYTCPSPPSTYTFSHPTARSAGGVTCHYTRPGTTTLPATVTPTTTTTTTTTTTPTTTTTTTSPSTTTPTRVITIKGVQANGHSPNPVIQYEVIEGRVRETIKYGQSLIEWQAVTGATRYKILYELVTAPPDDLPDEHTLPTPATSATIRGIIIGELYELKVEAYRGNALIGRSDTISTYPTQTPVTRDNIVGFIPILGYVVTDTQFGRNIGEYSSVLCNNIKDDPRTPINEARMLTNTEIREIEDGIRIWVDLIGGDMIRYTRKDLRECTDDELDSDWIHETKEKQPNTGRKEISFIWIAQMDDRIDYCDRDTSCLSFPLRPDNSMDIAQMIIRSTAGSTISTVTDGTSCSELFRVAVHEAGHAFGLHDVKGDIQRPSFMYGTLTRYCSPTQHDVAAVKAIYQSRDATHN